MKKPIRLNIGCGDNKIEGFINIDGYPGVKPDILLDIMNCPLPYKDGTVEEVVLFHCIEHIPEKLHVQVLGEIFRVLKAGGKFVISYPEFLKCVEAYKANLRGQREFFRATIYGRQSHVGDFHVSLMDTRFFKQVLKRAGFQIEKVCEEQEPYNTVVQCTKQKAWVKREDLLKREIFNS